MSNDDEISKITNPIIKGETPVYHLINEEKLGDLKNNGLAQDIAMLFASVFIGSFVSNVNWIILIAGLVCLGFATYFYFRKDTFITNIKKSGEVKSFTSSENESELKVIKATYGTKPDKVLDVTDKLNDYILDNKLNTKASNDLGGDPDKGVNKFLEIEYKIGDKTIDKTYKEGDEVKLP